MKHLFITGKIQTGKSTAIHRALEYRNLIIGGYRTVGGPCQEDGSSFVHLVPGDGSEPLGPDNWVLHRVPRNGQIVFEINEELFNTKGARLLKELPNDCQLILMDEIGKREKNCTDFCQAILQTLDGEIPVLGVVQIKEDAFLDKIRNHPNVEVLELTAENRDMIPGLINDWFSCNISNI